MRVLSLMLALALVVSCSDTVYLVITADDDGKTFDVVVDDPFEVQLPANPSTGFSWAPEPIDGVEFGAPQFVQQGTGVGAGGYERIVITVTESGSHRLVFGCSRSWEDFAPEQVFSVDIEAD